MDLPKHIVFIYAAKLNKLNSTASCLPEDTMWLTKGHVKLELLKKKMTFFYVDVEIEKKKTLISYTDVFINDG